MPPLVPHPALVRHPLLTCCIGTLQLQIRQEHKFLTSSPNTSASTRTTRSKTSTAKEQQVLKSKASSEEGAYTAGTTPKKPLNRRGALTCLAEAYGKANGKRPFVVQMASALVIFALGDMFAQRIGRDKYDPVKTARTAFIGGTIGFPQFKWFVLLSTNFNYTSRILSIFTKVLIHQAVFAPAFNSYFFCMQAVLSGETLTSTWARLKLGLPRSLINSLKYWPFVMTFNFACIPPELRSIVAAVASVGWQTYLSYLNKQVADRTARSTLA